MMVLSSFPFLKCRQLLRYSGEKANDDAYGCGFHVVAEFADNFLILLGSAVSTRTVKDGMSLQESGNGNRIASPPTRKAKSQPP